MPFCFVRFCRQKALPKPSPSLTGRGATSRESHVSALEGSVHDDSVRDGSGEIVYIRHRDPINSEYARKSRNDLMRDCYRRLCTRDICTAVPVGTRPQSTTQRFRSTVTTSSSSTVSSGETMSLEERILKHPDLTIPVGRGFVLRDQ